MKIARTRSAAERPVTIILLAVAVIALALFVAACGGSTTSTTGGNTTTSSSSATTGGAGGGTSQVIMKNRAFDPATVTIKAGDTVVWTNNDAPQHDVVADGGAFKSDLLNLGQTFSFTFSKAGTYPYYCSVHPDMKGTVVVQ